MDCFSINLFIKVASYHWDLYCWRRRWWNILFSRSYTL